MPGGFESLIRVDYTIFEKTLLKILEVDWALKVKVSLSYVEIRILFQIPKYLKDSLNSFGVAILSEILSSKKLAFLQQSDSKLLFGFLNNSLSK